MKIVVPQRLIITKNKKQEYLQSIGSKCGFFHCSSTQKGSNKNQIKTHTHTLEIKSFSVWLLIYFSSFKPKVNSYFLQEQENRRQKNIHIYQFSYFIILLNPTPPSVWKLRKQQEKIKIKIKKI